MQFWPRKKAKNPEARIKSWVKVDGSLTGFAGYKAGMTHLHLRDNSNSTTKGDIISIPVTIIECPPLKPFSLRFYKNKKILTEVLSQNLDKELARNIDLPKKVSEKKAPEDYDYNTLLAYTQPKLVSGVPKKKPEVIELYLGKLNPDKHKEFLEKEIKLSEVFEPGQLIDIHAITTGKGFQGPVKRFGVRLKAKKSEKGQRGVGSLGPWNQQQHTMFRVAHAGQTGFHQRIDYNKLILKISSSPEEINPKGGLLRYGQVRNDYILVKGSIPGPKKRLIKFTKAIRENKKLILTPEITHISLDSQQ